MTPSLATQAYREGFARTIVKKALFEGVWGAPARAELEALGERLFRQATAPGTGGAQRFLSTTLPAYGQLRQVSHALTSHPIHDPVVRDLFHQIGNTAHGKMRFYGTQLPMAAAGSLGVGGGLMAGQIAGSKARQQYDEQALRNMSIMDRLHHLILPQSLNLA